MSITTVNCGMLGDASRANWEGSVMMERAYKSYKLKLKFSFEQPLSLPKYYNSVLQGFFYKNMDPILASILYEVGFVYN
jgi:hypothetical protein